MKRKPIAPVKETRTECKDFTTITSRKQLVVNGHKYALEAGPCVDRMVDISTK